MKAATKRPQAKRASRRRYADALFSKAIKARDKVCQACGSEGPLEAAHFFRRSLISVRYDGDNVAALCLPCHRAFDQHEFSRWAWVSDRLGPERLDRLVEKAGQRWDRDWDRIHRELKEWV